MTHYIQNIYLYMTEFKLISAEHNILLLGPDVLMSVSLTNRCGNLSGRMEWNVLFNNTLNTFYLRLYGVGPNGIGPIK